MCDLLLDNACLHIAAFLRLAPPSSPEGLPEMLQEFPAVGHLEYNGVLPLSAIFELLPEILILLAQIFVLDWPDHRITSGLLSCFHEYRMGTDMDTSLENYVLTLDMRPRVATSYYRLWRTLDLTLFGLNFS
jgi:hypothetical protein